MTTQVWKAHGKKPADKNRCAVTKRWLQRHIMRVRLWVLVFTLFLATTAQASIPISTIEELQLIGNDPGYPLDGDYILTQNIDASSTAMWNLGAGFYPIGNSLSPFNGTFDGQGYIISGLVINRKFQDYVGLFSYIGTEALVENIVVNSAVVSGDDATGGLASINNGTVTNCHLYCYIWGSNHVGGLISINYGFVDNCSADSNTRGAERSGGLVGRNDGSITESFANGSIRTVSGDIYHWVGGLAGMNYGTINNCYATTSVNGKSRAGGLCGANYSGGSITDCFSIGSVTSTSSDVGGLVGYNTGTITDSYWNTQTSGRSSSAGGTGHTTDAMTYTYAADTFVGWDFTSIWAADVGYGINDGYPYLLNVAPVDLCATDGTAPLLVIVGSTTLSVGYETTYTDAGATAYDICDGDLTASIVVGGDTVDTNTLGTYIITYNVSDSASNAASEITRTVIVREPDTVPPVITMLGDNPAWVEYGEIYEDAGATALDNYDGDLTASIIVGGDIVDTSTTGTYIITYNVSDSAANAAPEVTRTVYVVEELTILLPGDVPLKLVKIPAGSFLMGRYAGEQDSYNTEDPQHSVTLSQDFYMGKYEVTQQQWLAVMGSWLGEAPSSGNGLGDNYPAYFVSWDDANDFIMALNTHITNTSQGPATVRLPSESEWEYACRAGTTTRFYFGDSLGCAAVCEDCAAGVLPGNRSDYMWYCGNNTPNGSKPVGGKLPNAFGLYDMSGNVWEWCEDDWHSSYTGAPANGSTWVKAPRGSTRVIRGGDWGPDVYGCRAARRGYFALGSRSNNLGFRVAASINEITINLPGDVPLEMVKIPAGTFMMGRYPGEQDSYADEDPQHEVMLSQDFYMGKYEVTQQQWLAVMDSWPGTAPSSTYGVGDNYPAYNVSWTDVNNFITSLNIYITNTSQGPFTVRLPSEAEWEYACRAGTTTRYYFGDSLGCGYECEDCAAGLLPENRSDYMWYCGNASTTMPVGGKLANAFGLYDMLGNIGEWCEDDYHNSYTIAPEDGSAWIEVPRASNRVGRGGFRNDDAQRCRSAVRYSASPTVRYGSIGFRLAATPPEEITINLPGDVPLELMKIPAGTFMMGSYSGEQDSSSTEEPQHQVTISEDFYMGKYEVTQEQWLAVMGSWPGTVPSATYGVGDNYPAYFVSWNDVNNFIATLNTHIINTSQGDFNVKLPSEAEWEYACRAGTTTRFYWGDDPSYTQINDYAWYDGNNVPNGTKTVGNKTANAFGLYDISGNVWEWCYDLYGAYSSESVSDPTGPITGTNRVLRGGSWYRSNDRCRSAHRNDNAPELSVENLGFRIAAFQTEPVEGEGEPVEGEPVEGEGEPTEGEGEPIDPCNPDVTAPVLTLIGSSVVTVECKGVYTEAGATATDNCNGNITGSIVVGGDAVNVNAVGSYTVIYNVTDSAGNSAAEVTRTVIVEDTISPELALLGSSSVTVGCGTTYVDAGAMAVDTCTGNLTSAIVAINPVNTLIPGTYTVRYNVSDGSSNAAAELTRTVVVQNNCVEGEPVEGEGEGEPAEGEGEGEPVEGEGEPVEGENEGETDPCDPDITPPVITGCASNQTVSADRSGVATVPLFTSSVIAQDTCLFGGALTAVQNPAEGSQVNVGNHDITITVADTAGNTATCTATLTVTPSWRYGDANLDGSITQSDITEIMRLIAGGVPSDENALITADIDQDGTIEESDMLAVFAFIRSGGIVTEIPKNLMAHSGVDEISLLWGPVPHDNVRGYMLERKIAGNTLGIRLPESADSVYYDNDIDSVEYDYRVAVVDILGNVETFSKSVTVLGNTLVLWAPWAQGLAGDEVIAPIGIGSTRGLKPKTVSITITYDPEVAEFQGLLTTVLSKPLNYLEPEHTPGQITLIATAPQGQIPVGEGRFFDLRMKLKEDMPDGCRQTLISDLVILNTESQGITTATMPGTICAGNAPWGDMNADSTVNMDDAQLALSIITRNMTPSSEQLFLGDLNGDRRIDAADAVLIMRLARGISINPEQNDKSVENKAFSSRVVSLPTSLSIAKGCSAVVPITVDDADLVAGMDLVISYTRADLQCEAVCPSPATAGYELTTDLGTGYVRLSFSDATALPSGETVVAYLIVTAIGDETLEGVRPPARIRINYAELKGDLGESFRWYGDIERKDAKVTIVESGECEEIPDCNELAGEGEVEGEITEGEGEIEGEPSEGEGEPVTLEEMVQELLDQFDTADTNGGGWLSYSEAQAILPELTREQFNQLDTNDDYILSRDELEDFLRIKSGCGCCKRTDDTKINIKRYIGDWLLVGLSLLVLVSFARRR